MSDYQRLLQEYAKLKEKYNKILDELMHLKGLFIEISYLINKGCDRKWAKIYFIIQVFWNRFVNTLQITNIITWFCGNHPSKKKDTNIQRSTTFITNV